MKSFILRWLATTGAVFVAAKIVPGIHWDDVGSLMVATLILGFTNALINPIFKLLSIPTALVGAFTAMLAASVKPALSLLIIPFLFFGFLLLYLVINGALLFLVGKLVHAFHVDGYTAAFWGALIISFVSAFFNALTGTGTARINAQVNINRGQPAPPAPSKRVDHSDGGPVIDV